MSNINDKRTGSANSFEFETAQARFEEKGYEAKILKVVLERNVNGPYGKTNRLKVYFMMMIVECDGKISGKEWDQTYYLRSRKSTRFSEFYEGVMEKKLPSRVDFDELVGKELWLEIVHNHTEEGEVYDNIKSVKPLKCHVSEDIGTI